MLRGCRAAFAGRSFGQQPVLPSQATQTPRWYLARSVRSAHALWRQGRVIQRLVEQGLYSLDLDLGLLTTDTRTADSMLRPCWSACTE